MRTSVTAAAVGIMAAILGAGEIAPTKSVPKAAGVKLTTVVEKLAHPWGMAWLPDGSILVTERPGRLRLIKDGVLVPEPITGVPEVLAQNQGGLLDITLHPDFAQNKLVYLAYSHGTRNANHTRIARGTFDGKALNNLQVIFDCKPDKPQGLHFGCRMVWLPDGTLLVTTGDGFVMRPEAQKTNSHLGKILRITDEGKAPSDNPKVDDDDAFPEVYTYGHRNVQGLARDPVSGRLWATEHGPLGGDELNIIEPGKNYGWSTVTYGREYSGQKITDLRTKDGMEDPKVVWTPVIAASGLAVYRGEKFPDWQGDVLAGGLISKSVRRVDVNDAGEVLAQEDIMIDQRVRDVRVGPDGCIYVLTDEDNGKLIRIEPASAG